MANLLKKIFSSLSGAFRSGAAGSVLGLDIGSASIKVVQLKKKGGKAILETYGAIALGPYAGLEVGQTVNLETDKLSEALTDLLRESNTTTKDGAISIPATASLIFTLELPAAVQKGEYSSVIPIEARKYIPIPISEVSLDWWVVPKEGEEISGQDSAPEPESKTIILVVAIRNDIISKYQSIIKQIKIQPSAFEMEVFSGIRSSFGHDFSSTLLLDLGALKTKLSIVDYGTVRSFHIINRGSQDITNNLSQSMGIGFSEAEKMKRDFGLLGNPSDRNISDIVKLSVDYILTEANNMVLDYEKKYNRNVSKVVLTGGGALLKGFVDLAADNFRSEVILGDPFSKIQSPAFLEDVLKKAGPEFSVAVGLALRKLQ